MRFGSLILMLHNKFVKQSEVLRFKLAFNRKPRCIGAYRNIIRDQRSEVWFIPSIKI